MPDVPPINRDRLSASHVAGLFLLLVAVPACNPVSPKVCSVMGCAPAFIVEISGAPAQPSLTVVATAPDGSSKSTTCHCATGGCTGMCFCANGLCTVHLEDFTPPTATIRLSWDSYTAEFTVRPTYETTYPNGRDCPGTCYHTRVAIALPPP